MGSFALLERPNVGMSVNIHTAPMLLRAIHGADRWPCRIVTATHDDWKTSLLHHGAYNVPYFIVDLLQRLAFRVDIPSIHQRQSPSTNGFHRSGGSQFRQRPADGPRCKSSPSAAPITFHANVLRHTKQHDDVTVVANIIGRTKEVAITRVGHRIRRTKNSLLRHGAQEAFRNTDRHD
jgi:hypothetical protein